MKNISYIKSIFCLIFTAAVLFGCEENLDPEFSSFVGFEAVSEFAVERNMTETRDIIIAASEVVSVDRTFTILVDEDASTLAASYSVPSTVTIPANTNKGILTLTVTDDDMLSFEAQKLFLSFQQEIGLHIGNGLEIDVVELCEDSFVTLALTFDNWAEESYWEIYDLSGTPTIVFSGGQSGAYDDLDNSSLSLEYCMAPGSYGIVVYDTYGDGGAIFDVSVGGVSVASGSVPDAGGGYPVLTQVSQTFTID